MSNTEEVFGGMVTVGSALYALAGVRAACSLYNPRDTEQALRTVLALGQLPSVADKRVWGHFARADGSDSFISTSPGEYRTVRPDSNEDLVVELSHADSEAILADRLRAILSYCQKYIPPGPEIESLRVTVDNFTTNRQILRNDAGPFDSVDNMARQGKGNWPELVQGLFREVLLEHKMTVVDFSISMALIQLQAMMGQWIEQNEGTYKHPMKSFRSYTHTLAASSDRDRLAKQLQQLGNGNYIDAGPSVKQALNQDSLIEFIKLLVVGVHQYFVARLVASTMSRESLNLPLVYKSVQAEEGYTCATTGISYPLTFVFSVPDTEPTQISRSLSARVQESSVLYGISSPLWPVFTKKFAGILLATAKTLLPHSFAHGLSELHRYENEYEKMSPVINVEFERGWIAHALLKAYRLTGNEARTKSYAAKIAAEMLMRRAFAERPTS